MKTPIPGKFTTDTHGNRVPVYAETAQAVDAIQESPAAAGIQEEQPAAQEEHPAPSTGKTKRGGNK